jgi:tetratricopeptide (TPR) repeat protein
MRASELLASLDRAELALRFRERAYGGAQAIAQDPPADLWLARLYAQDGQLEPAMRSLEALTRQALSPGEVTPSMSLPLLFNAAEMAHRLQRPELVDQLLSQVDRFDLPPMERTLRLARYQTRVGQLQASSLRLKSLLQEHPDSLQGARLLAINQLLAGELDEAMAVIRRALEEHPDHEPFKRLLMHEEMLEQNWRLNPVRALAPSLLEPTDEPNAQAAHRLFTLFAEHEERPQDTVRDLQQLLEEHRRLAPLWVLTLDRLYVWGEVELVESLIERMILEFPEQPLPAQILTRLRMSRQQWNQAAESAMLWRRRAGVGSRGAEEAEQAMAQAWLADGQAQRAVDLLADRFSQADRWDPNAPTLGLYLRALIRSGQQQRVEQQLITPLQQQPAAWLGPWTQAAKHLEAPQQTLAWLERVQPMVESLGPEQVQPRLVWASAFFELGARRARSESVRQRALDLAEAELHRLSQPPYDLPEALLQWTMIQGIHERWDTAIDGYERFLELRPDSAVAKNNLAMALLEKGSEDHARAQALAEEAVEQSSQRVEFVDTLARVYSHSQQWEKAQSAWRRVLEGLGSVDSRLFLAEALIKSGQTDEASQRLQDWTVDPQTLKADQRRRLASLRQRLGAATDQPQPATGP